tara:strand:- start:1389 stop:1898 length:510 start_codon:yes stop_codon:yes gene_type:complete
MGLEIIEAPQDAAIPDEAWREKWDLSVPQARFVRLVWGGNTATGSYMIAYGWPETQDAKRLQSAASSASKLLRTDKVKKALSELQEREASVVGMTRDVKRGVLSAIAMGEIEGTKPGDRIRAIALDNLMTGDNRPIMVQGDLTFRAVLDSLPDKILPGDYDLDVTPPEE